MDKKKIIIVGSDHKAALERTFQKELINKGFDVELFPSQTLFLESYNQSLFSKISYRAGFSSIIQQIQIKLKVYISQIEPSIVLVFKGMEITPETLKWIKNKGIKIYNYNPDHPFIFSGKGSGNKNVTNSTSLFDFYFSYANDVVENLSKLGINSKKISFGFDASGFNYKELNAENEILKVCFLGNADRQRAQFINELAQHNVEIDIYGENWAKFSMNDTINISSAKYGMEFWEILQKYAVQLNLLRPHNLNTHNMRSFDIPGSGGIMLAPVTDDHLTSYEDRNEVFLYKDINEAVEISNVIVNMTFEQRQQIRFSARSKSIKMHTYSNRVSEIVKYFDV